MEPFTINGRDYPVADVVLQCVVGVWGPDIGGLAILGDSTDVTVQDSIFGEGLYLSKHPEANLAEKGEGRSGTKTSVSATGSPLSASVTVPPMEPNPATGSSSKSTLVRWPSITSAWVEALWKPSATAWTAYSPVGSLAK